MSISKKMMPIRIAPKIRMGIFLLLNIASLTVILQPAFSVSDSALAGDRIVGTAEGKFFIRADNVSTRSVTTAFTTAFDIEIKGLETQVHNKVTYALEAATLEELIKGFLRHLKIQNYAFEFTEDKIKFVIILPGETKGHQASIDAGNEIRKPPETVTVTVIKSVLESSQAESVGLLPGDLIVEYDGTRIHTASQLVEEVKKKSAENSIEILVVREQAPMSIVVQGGFLGVRITTERIPKASFPKF